MKIILLQDVAKIGKRFSEVTVPDGYAMNQLIPKGLAQAATPENRKRLKASLEKTAAGAEAEVAALQAVVAACAETPLVLQAKANAEGHLFEAVKAEAIAAAAKARGLALSAAHIEIATPIKALGEHPITLHHGTFTKTITITIEAA